MERKFLEDLGLEKEVVDKVIAENETDIQETKGQLETQTNELTGQLNTAKEALKSFEGVDVGDLQGKITQLSNDLAQKDTDYQSQIADMQFGSQLDKAISVFGAKNPRAVKALLDLDSLKTSKNQESDIKTALESVKTDNDYLFTSDEPIKNSVKDTGNNTMGNGNADFMRLVMGLSPVESK